MSDDAKRPVFILNDSTAAAVAGVSEAKMPPPRGTAPLPTGWTCDVTVSYVAHLPDAPKVSFSNEQCEANAEVALAMILTALLRAKLPPQPM